jgi:hypothetical protein
VAAARRAAATGDRDAERAEIAALIALSLSQEADERTVERLHAVQTAQRSQQSDLRKLLEDQAISPETYLARLGRALAGAMRENEAILGPERFRAVLGEAGRHPTGLVDREVFLGRQATRLPLSDRAAGH